MLILIGIPFSFHVYMYTYSKLIISGVQVCATPCYTPNFT